MKSFMRFLDHHKLLHHHLHRALASDLYAKLSTM
jgi:hypothetical protein